MSPCSAGQPADHHQDACYSHSRFQARLQAHHAPMDFSAGLGGRIISDPLEAASVLRTSCPRGLRPGWPSSPLVSGSGSRSSLASSSSDRDPGTDLSLSPALGEVKWFKPSMGREQANSALFPHRWDIWPKKRRNFMKFYKWLSKCSINS